MKQLPISVDVFLAELQTPQNPNGKIIVTSQWKLDANGQPILDANGNKIDGSIYTLKVFDEFGNPLPDIVNDVPLRTEIQANITELQDILTRTIADEASIKTEIANYQIVNGLYDSMAPK